MGEDVPDLPNKPPAVAPPAAVPTAPALAPLSELEELSIELRWLLFG